MAGACKIMIVDDDPVLRLVASEMLGQHGYDVTDAEDGAVAIRMLQNGPVDLIVVDMLMPNKEGIETIQEIKVRWPNTRVVAISGGGKGLATGYLLGVAKALGADAVYEKPLRASGFVDMVREVLGEGPARPALAG